MESITNKNKYNEYIHNPAVIKFQLIFAWLLLTVCIFWQLFKNRLNLSNRQTNTIFNIDQI